MDVFLSYARSTSRAHAKAVYRELGGDAAGLAFLDTAEIDYGDRVPERIVDALLAARIVVIFADAAYFTRWYCILESRAARAAYSYLADRPGITQQERTEALEGLVVVLPPEGMESLDAWHLPPELQNKNWPSVLEPGAVAAYVQRCLESGLPTLAERIEGTIGLDAFRREWLNISKLPPPEHIPRDVPVAPLRGFPFSLQERFYGRTDDLWRIHDALTGPWCDSASAAAPTVALEGGAGVGKSRLALEYLYRFGVRHYSGGLFWVDAERPVEPQYYQITLALNPGTGDLRTVQSESGGVPERLISELRTLAPEKPALVVIDNIPEPKPGKAPTSLADWFPGIGRVATLVTSRARVSLGERGSVVPLPVDLLDADAALALLTADTDSHALDPEGWRQVVEWVGRLPLFLELLNRALVGRAFSSRELLDVAMSAATTRPLDAAMDALRDVVPVGTLRGATEALALSYERLPERAQAAGRLLAWLAPDPVPDSLLEELGTDYFDPAVRSMLVARSFVTETRSAEVPAFGYMHRVLADFLRTRSANPGGELTVLTQALHNLMPERQVGKLGPLVDACMPHAFTLFGHVAAAQPRANFVEHAAALALPLCYLLLAQGQSDQTLELASAALMACSVESESGERTIVVETPIVTQFIERLPEILAQAGEHDAAIDMLRPRVALLEQQPDSKVEQVLCAKDNLAWMLNERGHEEDLEEAQQILEQTLPIWRQRDLHSRDTLTALNTLALIAQSRGNSALAAKTFEEILEKLRHLPDVENETVATTQSLADSLWNSDREKATELLEQSLTLAEQAGLPDKHRLKLHALDRLAGELRSRGDYERAKPWLHRAVQAYADTGGGITEEVVKRAWALFDAQLRTGDIIGATATSEQYLKWLLFATEEDVPDELRGIREDVLTRVPS